MQTVCLQKGDDMRTIGMIVAVLVMQFAYAADAWKLEKKLEVGRAVLGSVYYLPKTSSGIRKNNILYVAYESSSMSAWDWDEGEKIWNVRIENIADGFTYNAGTIFVGHGAMNDSDGGIFAIDAITGEVRWQKETEGKIVSPPTIFEKEEIMYTVFGFPGEPGHHVSPHNFKASYLISGGYDNELSGYTAMTGEKLWTVESNQPFHASPVVAGNMVYTAGCDGMLRQTDAVTGEEKGEIVVGGNISAAPAVFIMENVLKAVTVDVANLSYTRQVLIPSVVLAVAVDTQGNVTAVKAGDNLDIKWQIALPDNPRVSINPTFALPYVIITDDSGTIYALKYEDGSIAWTFEAGSSPASVLALNDELIACGGKKVYALNKMTGERLWSYELGSNASGKPVEVNVEDGTGTKRFIVSCWDGGVYLFSK